MRNPYALYAKEILGLRPLDPLDSDPGAAERGQFVHEALDLFIRAHPGRLPDNALATLLALGRQAFGDILAHPTVAAFWWPRFARVADWFIAWEGERRAAGIRPIKTETWGKLDFPFPAGIFRLIAKADRVDALPDGTLAIIDYKTGTPPKARDVLSGYAPQLPLEGIIAEAGGFDDIPAAVVSDLLFLRLSGGNPPGETSSALGAAPAPAAIAEARAGLIGLVAAYDEPEARYPVRPRPEMAYEGDYAHLERIQEWSADG
jgi:ATP-dependent helicase/nuclease subunit B